ncbi:hypothetical protein KCP73_23875 [Salmonella enterica subsp. enterica]|nr:hypothetical protein KCP73_23875 [Salmonella enterica subsp. enterica]
MILLQTPCFGPASNTSNMTGEISGGRYQYGLPVSSVRQEQRITCASEFVLCLNEI